MDLQLVSEVGMGVESDAASRYAESELSSTEGHSAGV